LREFQEQTATWAHNRPHGLLLADVGAGKTAAMLTAIVDAQPLSVLVVATKAIAMTTWVNEAADWEHLAHLEVLPIMGTPTQRLRLLNSDADVYTVSYEWLPQLLELIDRGLTPGWDWVIFDEVSAMKSPSSTRVKRWRRLREKTATAKVFGLTATPVGEHLMDLFGEVLTVCGATVWGRSFPQWRDTRFYRPNPTVNYGWKPLPGAREQILADIRPHVLRIELPPEHEPIILDHWIALPPKARALYDALRNDSVLTDPPILCGSEGVLAGKLKQIATGQVYDEDRRVHAVHDAKQHALEQIVGSLQGQPALVVYAYQHELVSYQALVPGEHLHTGLGDIEYRNLIRRWNAGEVPVLYGHLKSMSHGLNLQHGGHHIIFTSPPYEHERYVQAIGRLARTGQTEQVVVHHINARGTVDETAAEARAAKADVEAWVLASLSCT
jgi:hypothetical protein